MSLRFLVLAAVGVLIGSNTALTHEPDDKSTPGPMTTYKSGAAFDPDGQVFMLGSYPGMVTRIHDRYVEDFIRRPFNGVGRVVSVRPQPTWMELVPDSDARRPYGSKWLFEVDSAGARDVGSRDKNQFAKGYDEIHATLKLRDDTIRSVRERNWDLKTQDLMSVNDAGGPAVYVINLHTRHEAMTANKEIKGADTKKRELTPFETEALKKLREGSDVVLQSSAKEMHVLGAVRARKDCLTCHEVKEGFLLGAFTYTLTHPSQETPAADRLTDTAGLSREEISAVLTIESLGGKVTREKGGPVRDIDLTHIVKSSTTRSSVNMARFDKIRDTSLGVLGVFPNLTALDVSHSLVTDEGLTTIAKLHRLESLNLQATRVSDDGLEMITKLTRLKTLDVRNTYVTEKGVARLKSKLPDCTIRSRSAPEKE
jgi:hypothetical protein